MDRRQAVVSVVLYTSLSDASAQGSIYRVVYGGGSLAPFALATCDQLEREASRLRELLKELEKDPTETGRKVREKVLGARETLDANLNAAQRALEEAKIRSAFDRVGAGLAVLLPALGVALGTPLAIGATTAIAILTAPSLLVLQLIQVKQVTGQLDNAYAMGYTKDRALFLTQLTGEAARSSRGKVFTQFLGAMALAIEAAKVINSSNDVEQAKVHVRMLTVELKVVSQMISRFSNDDRAWSLVVRRQVAEAADRISAFIASTRSASCIAAPIPILRKP